MTQYDEAVRLIKMGRRAERRGKAIRGCIGSLIAAVITDLLNGWLLMLAIGIAHDHWWPAIPTIGYWWAVLIVLVTPVVFTPRRYKKGDES